MSISIKIPVLWERVRLAIQKVSEWGQDIAVAGAMGQLSNVTPHDASSSEKWLPTANPLFMQSV